MVLYSIFYYFYSLSNYIIIIINYIKNIYNVNEEKNKIKIKKRIDDSIDIESYDTDVVERINNNYCYKCNKFINKDLFMISDKPFCSNYCRNLFSKNNLII